MKGAVETGDLKLQIIRPCAAGLSRPEVPDNDASMLEKSSRRPGGGVGNFSLLAASLSASACCFVTSTNRPSRLRAGVLSVEIAATAAGELLSICAASAGGWNVEAAMQRARHTRRLDRR